MQPYGTLYCPSAPLAPVLYERGGVPQIWDAVSSLRLFFGD